MPTHPHINTNRHILYIHQVTQPRSETVYILYIHVMTRRLYKPPQQMSTEQNHSQAAASKSFSGSVVCVKIHYFQIMCDEHVPAVIQGVTWSWV